MPVPVKDRTGETIKSSKGQLMTIIAFRRCDDLDVQFEDGTVVTGKTYSSFKKGQIKNPTLDNCVPVNERVGYQVINGSGYLAECIYYGGEKDTHIKFEDGTVVVCKWNNFIRGTVRNPNQKKATGWNQKHSKLKQQRVGETVIAQNGQQVEIIDYIDNRNITVRFEDGTVVENIRYDHFRDGVVGNPNYRADNPTWRPFTERVGEIVIRDGEECVLVEYNSTRDVKVQFPTGEIITTSYNNFKKGIFTRNTGKTAQEIYVGLTGVVTANGEGMRIIGYRNSDDIDVEFDDGTVIKSNLQVFRNGSCVNPNNLVNRKGANIKRTDYVGRVGYSKKGQKMTIIGYRTAADIDVEFENGVVVEHARLSSFNKSEIRNPKLGLGAVDVMNCGVEAKIVEWETINDIVVEFEDGARVKSYWAAFQKGYTKHPTLRTRENGGKYRGFITDRLLWFGETKDQVYYSCMCEKCKMDGILTPTEMLEHYNLCKE